MPTARGSPAAIAVETSENAKLGPVSATYVGQQSCPDSCPLLNRGCYAETGPVGIIARRLSKGRRGSLALAREEARAIAGLTGDRLLRLHVVGDTATNPGAVVLGKAAESYGRRGMRPLFGKKVWTYTHAWKMVRRESWGQAVSVLASCEDPKDVAWADAAGYAAALVVPSFERPVAYTLGGLTVLPCPNQTTGVTCHDCGLCRNDERLREAGLVIGFAAHGARANTVRRHLEEFNEA